MEKKGRRVLFHRVLALLCVCCLCAGALLPAFAADGKTQGSSASFFEKKEKYDIAMVFDNSLSMFWDEGQYTARWSRAKFAMEIFASMLDFPGGDKLTIFPMWQVAYDGKKPGAPDDAVAKDYLAGEKNKIQINNRSDIDSISKMYTIFPDDTPFDAVENALKYLKDEKTDSNKWLIILTDGAFDMRNGQPLDTGSFNVRKEINKLHPDGIYIQYLAIDPKAGNKQIPKADEKNSFYSDSASGNDIQQKLIEVCNRIFERNELRNAIKGTNVTLDISMKKVIVFAQGDSVKIQAMRDLVSGEDPVIVQDSGQRRYSDYSAGASPVHRNFAIDKIKTDQTLSGQVVTFGPKKDSIAAGEYALEIDGFNADRDKLQVFYEPDVRVQTDLIDKDGNTIKEGDDIFPGKYKVQCSVVDSHTGKDVSSSPLLGNDLVYNITVSNDGKEFPIKNGDAIKLKEGGADIKTAVTYLKGRYTITNQDSPLFKGIHIVLPELSSLKLSGNCLQPNNWYQLTKSDSWQPVHLNVTVNGEKLTDAQMKALKISYSTENGGVALSHRLIPGESAFEIDIGRDEAGNFVPPAEMITTLKVSAAATDTFKREYSDKATFLIEIHKHSVMWGFILGGSILAGVLAVLLWFMSRKVLPRAVKATLQVYKTSDARMEGQGKAVLVKKTKRIRVQCPPPTEPSMDCHCSFEVEPVSRRWTPSKNRVYKITKISGTGVFVDLITINSHDFAKNERGIFVSVDNPDAPINMAPRKSYDVNVRADDATFSFKIINSKKK